MKGVYKMGFYTDTCSEDEILGTDIFKRTFESACKRGENEDDAYTEAYSASMQYLDKDR